MKKEIRKEVLQHYYHHWRARNTAVPEMIASGGKTDLKSCRKHPYVYYNQFRPILLVLRLFGRYSLQVTENGEYKSSWLSLQMLYCILIYGLQTYLAVIVCFRRLQALNDSKSDYDEFIFSIHILAYLNIHFHVPFTYWLEGSKMANYLTQWATFQEDWENTFGTPLKMNFQKAVPLYIVILIPAVVLFLIFEQNAVLYDPILYFLPYFMTITSSALVLGMWFCTCLEIKRLTRELNCILMQRLHSQTSPWLLSRWRLLWLDLRSLTASLGTELSAVLISTLLTYSTTFLLGIYNGLTQIITRSFDIKALGYLSGAGFSLILIYSFCDGGHRATDGVYLLVEAIKANPPEIKVGGFVTLNRPLVVGLISTTLTYLIVLLQFKVNEEEQKS